MTKQPGLIETNVRHIVGIVALRCVLTLFLLPGAVAVNAQLRVSDNGRYLQTLDGKPFFWLGDTAWELFHRLSREEAEMYLKNRAAKGFTVIQAVAVLIGQRLITRQAMLQ